MEGLAEGTRTKDGDADKQVDSASVLIPIGAICSKSWILLKGTVLSNEEIHSFFLCKQPRIKF